MATASGTGQGKTSFVEEFLRDHGDADLAAVNAAWRSFGREGTISESLFGKTKRSLGLTKKQSSKQAKPADVTPGAMTPAVAREVGKKSATPRRVSKANVEESTTRQDRRAVATSTSRAADRNQMLIALEKDLDRLLFGVQEMESLTEVEEHIRAARRVVSREIL